MSEVKNRLSNEFVDKELLISIAVHRCLVAKTKVIISEWGSVGGLFQKDDNEYLIFKPEITEADIINCKASKDTTTLLKKSLHINPVSLNAMYPTSKYGRRFLSNEGVVYEATIRYYLAKEVVENNLHQLHDLDFHMSLSVEFGMPDLYFKNGTVKNKDCSNHIKPVEDAVAKFFGYNDSLNFEVYSRKYYSPEPHIKISLYKFL